MWLVGVVMGVVSTEVGRCGQGCGWWVCSGVWLVGVLRGVVGRCGQGCG